MSRMRPCTAIFDYGRFTTMVQKLEVALYTNDMKKIRFFTINLDVTLYMT